MIYKLSDADVDECFNQLTCITIVYEGRSINKLQHGVN